MAGNETHIHWTGSNDETVIAFDQSVRIRTSTDPNDPIGTLLISSEAFAGTPLPMPNSISATSAWTAIPGTSPAIEVRQDAHYPIGLFRVRIGNAFTNMTPVGNITQGSKAGATRLEENGDVVRMRGILTATGAIANPATIATVTSAHIPLAAVSTQVRWTGGTARLQVTTSGSVILSATLALNDQVWLDGVTYDLLA